MSYNITKTNGQTLATITDGTVNNITSLTLVGKNYPGYGIFLNENFVYLLENFSNTTAPSNPLTGQLWYDAGNNILKVYNTNEGGWKPISSSISQPLAPSSSISVIGDIWWDTTNAQLKVYNGSGTWVTVGPASTSGSGLSGAIPDTISDGTSNHFCVKFYVNNTIVAILSKDSQYQPASSISGFTYINPGFNLVSSSYITGAQYTGSVSNALTLQGVAASQFLRSDQNTSTAYQLTVGGGLVVGSDLNINTTSASEVKFVNQNSSKDLNFYITQSNTAIKSIGVSASTGTVTFANAVTATGALTTNGAFSASGAASFGSTVGISGVLTVSAQTLPVSNNQLEIGSSSRLFANVWATTFRGTSVQANYADLAERFEADVPMVPGTVVELGGVKEITTAIKELSESVFGVISTLPGFLLNGGAGTDQSHPAVAVNGRVPVRVVGQVKKGDRLVSAGNGLARAAQRSEITAFNVIGRALADKITDDEGTVEAIVKLNS